jgi:osmoprotectant transport system ATP-binding protein
MPESAIQFADVGYKLPAGRELLRGISFDIGSGTTTALLGRSGSGKTTLLRMVNGLAMPTSGTVLVRGQKTRNFDIIELRRGIGYVIQETGLFPHRQIASNVGMPLEVAGRKNSADYLDRIYASMTHVGLPPNEFANRYPWQLSGGQRQRAGVARALVANPDILLMDEPFGALDPLTRADMQLMLRDLLQRVRKTVLLVTHDLAEALYLADRVIFLETGEIVADLGTNEVLTSQNPHVRGYVDAVRRTAPKL